MLRQADAEEVARALGAISSMSRTELMVQWTEAHGGPPPKGVSRRLLERSAAFHLQADLFGGHRPVIQRRISVLARSEHRSAARVRRRPASGTRFIREWNGRTHTVEVTASGFLWNGTTWRSLSAVARAITGARWSGPRFFGL